MAIIAPFKGTRYNLDIIKRIEHVIAPPYDVIGEKSRDELYELSPYNVIRLILGKDEPGDSQKINRYTRAAEYLKDWLEKGVLLRDPEPSIYAYYIDFDKKLSGRVSRATRKGFVARLKLHPYQEGVVLPHERTLRGPKEDRLNLIKHCRANFSHVFCLFEQKDQEIYNILDENLESQTPDQYLDQEQVRHSLWRISDPSAIRRITDIIKPIPVIIADGHHRYETGLSYLKHIEKNMPLLKGSADYTMAYFTDTGDSGLVLYPYHRIVRNLPKVRFRGLAKKLAEFFDMVKIEDQPLYETSARKIFMEKLSELGKDIPAFGMADMEKGVAYYLTPKGELWKGLDKPTLDVIVLEELILKDILRIPAKALFEGKYVIYETDYDQAFETAEQAKAQIIFFLNPVPTEQVIQRALKHRVMPEKSTYFYPKLSSGIVMNMLDD